MAFTSSLIAEDRNDIELFDGVTEYRENSERIRTVVSEICKKKFSS